jgi:hypothetical protein
MVQHHPPRTCVEERHIPDRGRGILENSIVGTRFPIA